MDAKIKKITMTMIEKQKVSKIDKIGRMLK